MAFYKPHQHFSVFSQKINQLCACQQLQKTTVRAADLIQNEVSVLMIKTPKFDTAKVTLTEKVKQTPCRATVHHKWFIVISVISPKAVLIGPTTY